MCSPFQWKILKQLAQTKPALLAWAGEAPASLASRGSAFQIKES